MTEKKTQSAELTTRQAAELAKVDPSYIRRLLIDERLQGHKVDGWLWMVSRASFDQWMSERKPRGG